MNQLEKLIVFGALLGQIVIIGDGVRRLGSEVPQPAGPLSGILVPIVFILSAAMLVLAIRDLYRREFASPNAKPTWLSIMAFTGGIGVIVYVFRHAIHSRLPAQR